MTIPKKMAYCMRGIMVLAAAALLAGCSFQGLIETFHLNALVSFFTAGPVADYERNLMFITLGLMIFVLVPVVVLTLWFAWHYRASNNEATYRPHWRSSKFLEMFLWSGPIVIVIVLGITTWISTYHLDPYRPIKSDAKPIRIDAIAMDWKWLFVYPDYDVAAINQMEMPVNVPVSIHLTSDSVMNAFMIPRLGSQIFAMAGMSTQLHLMASRPGAYLGKNYQYTGEGFDNMGFHAIATSRDDFNQWIARARWSGQKLDVPAYRQLSFPSQNVPVTFYSPVMPHLFRRVIASFHGGHGGKLQAATTPSAQ